MMSYKGVFLQCFLFMGLLASISAQIDNCSDNFTPCTCSSTTSLQWTVTCNRAVLSEVKTAFESALTVSIYRLELTPSETDNIIPANLIGEKQLETLAILCPNRQNNPLRVDIDSFRSSSESLNVVSIEKCDLSRLDWSFLTGFNNLAELSVQYSSNLHQTFATLPSLPSLTQFDLYSVTDLNQLVAFPRLTSGGIVSSSIHYNYDLGDEAMSRILDWLLPTSASTMTSLSLAANSLSVIPQQIRDFTNLEILSIYNNLTPITSVNSGSFNLPKIRGLYLDNSVIGSLQTGAFQGDFSTAYVEMYRNSITRFEAGVFRTMLRQMANSSGRLEMYANPFDCTSDPCHLAWLIRDEPELLSAMWSTQCSNGTYFHELNPASFQNC